MTFRHILIALTTFLAMALGAPAGAAQLSDLTVSANPAQVNQGLKVEVTTSGGRCGYKLELGYTVIGPNTLDGAKRYDAKYTAPGTYTVKVYGAQSGSTAPCDGQKTLQLVVKGRMKMQASPPGAALHKMGTMGTAQQHAPSQGLQRMGKPKGPKPGSTPLGDAAKANTPKLETRPVVHEVQFVPDPQIGNIGGKIMAPGGVVKLKGGFFGSQKGRVVLEVDGSKFPEYPGGEIELQNVKWLSNGRVEGTIPKPMTGPIFRAYAHPIVIRADGKRSEVVSGHFEVPVEKRILSHTEAGVKNLSCDSDWCAPEKGNGVPAGITLSASAMYNASWDIGAFGSDLYSIDLKDGWVFSRVVSFDKHTSGDDGDFIKDLNPDLKKYEDHWSGRIDWYCSGDDFNNYQVKIEVMRAKGAY
jgi:hypothetical protein